MQKKMQVFVSSTFTDLISERQAAVAAILKAGHMPAGMELFTAGNQSQMDVIRRWIDDCDIYMLILGGRYGSIEPNTGLSYTELEFDYAVANNKPLFSIVATERAIENKVKENGSWVLETENASLLRQFREKVLSNVNSFFSDEKDVKLAVYESVGDLILKTDMVGWIRSSEVARFEDQATELEQLRLENQKLRESLLRASTKRTATRQKEDFPDFVKFLSGIEVKLPEGIRQDGDDGVRDLLSLFINNRDVLVSGVTDSPFNDDLMKFMYYNVATKLKVHGLMGDKRLIGKKINCLATTSLGDSLLAWVDKRVFDNKRGKKSEEERIEKT